MRGQVRFQRLEPGSYSHGPSATEVSGYRLLREWALLAPVWPATNPRILQSTPPDLLRAAGIGPKPRAAGLVGATTACGEFSHRRAAGRVAATLRRAVVPGGDRRLGAGPGYGLEIHGVNPAGCVAAAGYGAAYVARPPTTGQCGWIPGPAARFGSRLQFHVMVQAES